MVQWWLTRQKIQHKTIKNGGCGFEALSRWQIWTQQQMEGVDLTSLIASLGQYRLSTSTSKQRLPPVGWKLCIPCLISYVVGQDHGETQGAILLNSVMCSIPISIFKMSLLVGDIGLDRGVERKSIGIKVIQYHLDNLRISYQSLYQ